MAIKHSAAIFRFKFHDICSFMITQQQQCERREKGKESEGERKRKKEQADYLQNENK